MHMYIIATIENNTIKFIYIAVHTWTVWFEKINRKGFELPRDTTDIVYVCTYVTIAAKYCYKSYLNINWSNELAFIKSFG